MDACLAMILGVDESVFGNDFLIRDSKPSDFLMARASNNRNGYLKKIGLKRDFWILLCETPEFDFEQVCSMFFPKFNNPFCVGVRYKIHSKDNLHEVVVHGKKIYDPSFETHMPLEVGKLIYDPYWCPVNKDWAFDVSFIVPDEKTLGSARKGKRNGRIQA